MTHSRPPCRGLWVAILAVIVAAETAAYPLDGEEASGIRRLAGSVGTPVIPAGGRWPTSEIRLHLLGLPMPDFDAVPEDPVLHTGITELLQNRDPSYALVVVDLTDPAAPRWAGLRSDLRQNPGSVGKLVLMLALFDTLARAFPDTSQRQQVLRQTVVEGGLWVLGDEHPVPRYDAATGVNGTAVLSADDSFRLSEWLDHAISASANGAGSVVWREAMLLEQFGAEYPPDPTTAEVFFTRTPKTELAALARRVVVDALTRADLDPNELMQGSFFTGTGKRFVPGGQSYATPRELARFMFRMEQGRLVDPWSSLEMKRYTYMTKRRYRYAYAPELATSAVFFKSGSLYQCKPEEGYRCAKYMGNARNLMNSVTLVESPGPDGDTNPYIAALMSNVLKFNSAWDHARIAAAVHTLVRSRAPVTLQEEAPRRTVEEAGKSD